jgi:nucleoside-diphosphate-sugar epimerase
VVLDNFSIGRLENVPSSCEVLKGDVLDETLLSAIPDIDYILHFGAPSSVVLFNRNPQHCLIETTMGLRNVLEYAKINGVKKVIFPSSSSVYGNTSLPQSETTSCQPTNLYGVAKLSCEYIARLYSEYVPYVALRIFAGYGPGEEHKKEIASVITLFINDILKNSSPIIFGDGTQSRDFVYIEDIVNVAMEALEKSFTGIVNVGSGHASSFNEIVGHINNLLGKNINPSYIDKPNNYFEHTLADITKTTDVFSVAPTSLEKGIKSILEAKGEKTLK